MIRTRDQIWAERAAQRVNHVTSEKDKYLSFARSFPSLIHTCGLMQALAFVAKKNQGYLCDFVFVLNGGQQDVGYLRTVYEMKLMEYVVTSRDAIQAASWLKRYAEALLDEPNATGDDSQ